MKKILFLIISVISIQLVQAQKGYGAITYSMGVPMGDMSDYIDKTSYRGINVELFWPLKNNLDVGMEAGWNVFYAKENLKTYTHESAAITGVQYRYVNAVPLLAAARWRKKGDDLQPFAGLGIGTSSMNRNTDFGLYRIINNTWQFCIRPEAGLIYNLSEATSATIGVKYYNNFKNDEQDAQNFLAVNVGFVFGLSGL